MKTSGLSGLVIAAAVAAGPAGTAAGAPPHHRPRATPSAPSARPADGYYPETIGGGVPGNLSFNNQVRKLSDPLNANGAK